MARIPLIKQADARLWRSIPRRRRLLLSIARRRYGTELDATGAIAHHPGVYWPWGLMELANDRRRSVLPGELGHLVEVVAAAEIGCSWCVDFGAALWERKGLDPGVVREAVRWRESTAFGSDERAAFAYAVAVCAQPPAVDDAMVADLRDRFGDAGVVELTYLIALENLRSRFNSALGLSSQGFSSGDVCSLLPASRSSDRSLPGAATPNTVSISPSRTAST